MDDDIRDRFRGVRRAQPTPSAYGRTARPVRPNVNTTHLPTNLTRPSPATSVASSNVAKPLPPPNAPTKIVKKRHKDRSKLLKKSALILVIITVIILLTGGGYALYKKFIKSEAVSTPLVDSSQPVIQAETSKPSGKIRFIAIGTSLAFDSINNNAKRADGSYDYLPMMVALKPFLAKSDIRLCNQTTPGGGDKNGLAISGYPTFNAPLEWSSGFAGLGCNLINLASDHINDKGQQAINETLNTWDAQQNILAVAGANRTVEEQSKIRYFTIKGLKFAFLAYTTSNANKQVTAYGVNMYSDDLATKQIEEARKNANLVIVSMNWGTENSPDINADQDRIAQHLANNNADVIIGGGPRVLQPAKVLNGKNNHQTLVWFSLGNFLTSELPIDNLIGGMAIMDFDVGKQTLIEPKLLPLYMHYEWTAQQKTAGTLNARHDFSLIPLDLATDALARSQNSTTVEAQTGRVTSLITKFAPIQIIKSTEL